MANNWHSYTDISTTRLPAGAIDSHNIVHLKGAMYRSGGTDKRPFVLPVALRPSGLVYVPVDLVNGNAGYLIIQPNGTVSVEATGDYINAVSFTSLEGVTYSTKPVAGLKFTPLTLQGGWQTYGFTTRDPAGALDSDGIVHLQGAMDEPTGNSAFSRPKALTPGSRRRSARC